MRLKKLRICYFASFREKQESKQFLRDLLQEAFSDGEQQKEITSTKKTNNRRKKPKTVEKIRENSKRIMGKPYKVVSNENI